MKKELLVGVGGNTLLLPGARAGGVVVAGRVVIEGGGAASRKVDGGAVLACPVDVQGVKEVPALLLLLDWRPCNSFSANKAR